MINSFEELIAGSFPFVNTLLEDLKNVDIDVSGLEMDHICFRVEHPEQYDALKSILANQSVLLVEHDINGRLIASYRLFEPIIIGAFSIEVFELPAKKGSPYALGYEHVEFVTDVSLEDFLLKYPNLKWDLSGINKKTNRDIRLRFDSGFSVKFHEQSLEKVIQAELEAKTRDLK